MTMPFGKFRDVPLCDIPTDYLRWLSTQEFVKEWLRIEVIAELEHRSARQIKNPVIAVKIDAQRLPLAREVFELGYRALSKRLHPDIGGEAEDQLALNSFVRELGMAS